MKRVLGWVLLLAGICVVCAGLYLALSPLIHTYQSALDDPLKDAPISGANPTGEEDGKALARQMFKGVAVGALGLPLTIAGTVLLGVSFIQRMRKRMESRQAR
ncbi:MAG: hypothetical protein U0637_07345 [Phycisphaerales bacterium]